MKRVDCLKWENIKTEQSVINVLPRMGLLSPTLMWQWLTSSGRPYAANSLPTTSIMNDDDIDNSIKHVSQLN